MQSNTKVAIETINGKLCTVIRRSFDAEKVRESLAMGGPTLVEIAKAEKHILLSDDYEGGIDTVKYRGLYGYDDHIITCFTYEDITAALVILPALPRNPKPEDAALIAAYNAQGLVVFGEDDNGVDLEFCVQNGKLWCYNDNWEVFGALQAEEEITHCVDASGNRVDVAIEGVV